MSSAFRMIKYHWIILLSVVFSMNAYAVDGVLEINQTCAAPAVLPLPAVGCFPGDAPGFPVTITTAAPGNSFRLTGDLTIASAAVTAIQIQSSDVVIDLNGFTIFGPASCTGDRPTCSGASLSGNGIAATSAFQEVTVRNGTIRGMGNFGINLPAFSRVEQLQIVSNAGGGVNVLEGSIVRHNLINNNGGDGIHTTEAPMITGNTVYNNRDDGIDTVEDNNVNDEIGGGMISGNLIRGNGTTNDFNLRLDATAVYQNNVITLDPDDSGSPALVTGGVNMGGNFCDTGDCP